MKVGFACVTGYHIFISYILANTLYKNDKKVIFLSNLMNGSNDIYKRLKESNVFEEVFFIEENHVESRFKNYRYMRETFKRIDYKGIEILHVFTWGIIYSSYLSNRISKSTKIILTEDGLGTYFLAEEPLNIKDKVKNILFKDNLNFKEISEIYLFNKKLYSGVDKYRSFLRDIDIKHYFNDEYFIEKTRCELNFIFDLDNKVKLNMSTIFFDQNISSILDKEKFLELFCKDINSKDIQVKLHHLHGNNHYVKYNFDILDTIIPWEVIYLNNNKKQLTYITYYSSAVFNSKVIFGTNDKIILLFDILDNNKEILQINNKGFKQDVKLMREYLDNFKLNYPEVEVYVPKDFEELKEILNNKKN